MNPGAPMAGEFGSVMHLYARMAYAIWRPMGAKTRAELADMQWDWVCTL